MEFTLHEQTVTFLWSLILGMIIVCIYIIISVIREFSPPKKLMLIAEDILFMGIAAALNFFFALSQTHGYIRAYVIFGQIISFSLIYFTLGKLLKNLAGAFVRIISCGFERISVPLINLLKNISDIVSKQAKKIKK